jgi:L-threonylcarbamoyladenylate synthase
MPSPCEDAEAQTSKPDSSDDDRLLIEIVNGADPFAGAREAARRLRAGGVVAVPTETVYGLAACADQPAAIARVFEIKGRPSTHPLILHLADATELSTWVAEITDSAALLASTCWPGPLTLLLRRSPKVSDLITGGRDTVAIRVPAHAVAREVLHLAGPFVAPSANRFGHVSPTTATHVKTDLGTFLDPSTDGILDGGPCEIGVESTIVDCTVTPVQILRHGGVTAEEIERILTGPIAEASGSQRASGMLASHYAPRIPVQLCESDTELAAAVAHATAAGLKVAVIDLSTDLGAYARDLYALLREAEDSDHEVIIARMPKAQGLGLAIRDRLSKAAAPRP